MKFEFKEVQYLDYVNLGFSGSAKAEQNPDLPIIILPRPKYYITEEEKIRLKIIQATYENAINSGDRNVYLIDNSMLMELCKNDGTVDNCHCTDLGFFSMADKIGKIIEKILEKNI